MAEEVLYEAAVFVKGVFALAPAGTLQRSAAGEVGFAGLLRDYTGVFDLSLRLHQSKYYNGFFGLA